MCRNIRIKFLSWVYRERQRVRDRQRESERDYRETETESERMNGLWLLIKHLASFAVSVIERGEGRPFVFPFTFTQCFLFFRQAYLCMKRFGSYRTSCAFASRSS